MFASGLDVPGQPVLEARILRDRIDDVVPAAEPLERQLALVMPARAEHALDHCDFARLSSALT
jgi:hypothetical protein